MIVSVSTLTGVLFSLPAGLLSDRFGRKNLLRVSMFVLASAPFLYLLSVNTWQLALVRFYHGLATAVFTPIAMALVVDIFPTQRGERLG
jgi:MFS transporter, DHA1 family, multidrug resistance protein